MYPSKNNPQHGIFIKRELQQMLLNYSIDYKIISIDTNSIKNFLKSILLVISLNFQNKKTDLVHSYHGLSGFIGLFYFKSPKIATFTGSDLNRTNPKVLSKSSFVNYISILVSFFSSFNIVRNKAMLSKIKGPGAIIPSGVDLSFFKSLEKRQCRKSLNLSYTKKYILFVGNKLDSNKDYSLFQSSFELIKNEIDCEEIVAYNLDRVHFLIILNSIDVLIFTSKFEGSSNTIKESIACGIPIVSVDVGDSENLLNNYAYGKIVPRNKESISKSCLKLIKNKLEVEGHKIITKKELSLDQTTQKIYRQYTNLI